jgi:O-antigen/teichoic acid export membrane protein
MSPVRLRPLRKALPFAFVVNFIGIGIVGVCGILLHSVIGSIWGSATLGAFNQVLGAYLLASQLACAGQQNAALRFTAASPQSAPAIAVASLLLCAAIALVVAVIFYLSRNFVGWLLASDATARGMVWAAPGLFFFALNKTILAVFNGLNHMIRYSVLQTLRFIAIIGFVVMAAVLKLDSDMLPLALTGAELLVFLIGMACFARIGMIDCRLDRRILRDLFYFGLKSLPASGLTQINQRADVLILGFFASDSEVGIYSLASTIVEGFLQALIVLRALYAPSLIAALEFAPASEKAQVVKKALRVSYVLAAAATAVALIGFPFFLSWSGLGRNFSDSFPIFAVLQVGMALAAGYIVLGTILMLGNRPADQSRYVAMAVAINISANFALAATYGARGAAFATAGSAVLSSILLHRMMKRRLSLAI